MITFGIFEIIIPHLHKTQSDYSSAVVA